MSDYQDLCNMFEFSASDPGVMDEMLDMMHVGGDCRICDFDLMDKESEIDDPESFRCPNCNAKWIDRRCHPWRDSGRKR